jgi:hypothetical protein
MPAFEEITAADFDHIVSDYVWIEDRHLREKWYTAAGELNTNAIESLSNQTANFVAAVDGKSANSTESGPMSELTRVLQSLSSMRSRERILQLTGPSARIVLDAIQTVRAALSSSNWITNSNQWLDLSAPEHPLRRQLLYLLIKLAAASHLFPTNMFLKGVDLGEARDPWNNGGFADIFRGTYRGQAVAGKKVRSAISDRESIHAVRSTSIFKLCLPITFRRLFVEKHLCGIS